MELYDSKWRLEEISMTTTLIIYIFNKLACQLGHMILISHTYEDSFEF
jgi:hypothetical protein